MPEDDDFDTTVRGVFSAYGYDIDATPIDKLMANEGLGFAVADAMENENY